MITPFKHYSLESVPTIYDEEAMTVLQLCARLGGKSNEIIKVLNDHGLSITELVQATQNMDNHLLGIAETLSKLVVEPLGFATPQMFGATGDGVADDTQAIKAAVASLKDHSALLYFPAGTYLVSEDIELRSNITVAGAGNSVIKRATNTRTHYSVFRCVGVSNVVIRDLIIMGDNATHEGSEGEWGHCVSLEGAQGITFDRCNLANAWGDGLYIASDGDGEACGDIVLRDTRVAGNRRNGISVINVDGLKIDGCLITNNKGTEPQAGIDFEPNNKNEAVLNVKVCNTTFENNGKDVLFADTVSNLYFNKYVTFTGCVFKSAGGLDWRSPLNEEYNTGNQDCYVRFDGCQFINSYRGIRITKGAWDTPLTLTGCDFTCNGIAIEVGESGKDYTGHTLGGVSLLNCRVHKNSGSSPVVRCVGNGGSFADITADLYVHRNIQAYGYFSGNAENIHLDFHEGVFQTGVSQTFDKYKVPSTIYMASTATASEITLTLADNFPRGQVVRVINDTQANVVIQNTGYEIVAPAGVCHITLTPSGDLCGFGGL